jgi:hypothetical protein
LAPAHPIIASTGPAARSAPKFFADYRKRFGCCPTSRHPLLTYGEVNILFEVIVAETYQPNFQGPMRAQGNTSLIRDFPGQRSRSWKIMVGRVQAKRTSPKPLLKLDLLNLPWKLHRLPSRLFDHF